VEEGQEEDVTAVVALLLLVVMFVIGARVRGVRFSFWKTLAFVAACVVVLALLLAILAK
jgi:ABC-type multidrug transport system permease subunit